MKRNEIIPGVEYAHIAPNSRYRGATKVKFESIPEAPHKWQLDKSEVMGLVWRRDYLGAWDWQPAHLRLPFIRQTWAEYEEEQAREEKLRQEERERRERAREKRAANEAAFREFLRQNYQSITAAGLPLSEYEYGRKVTGNLLTLEITREQLEALLERAE